MGGVQGHEKHGTLVGGQGSAVASVAGEADLAIRRIKDARAIVAWEEGRGLAHPKGKEARALLEKVLKALA